MTNTGSAFELPPQSSALQLFACFQIKASLELMILFPPPPKGWDYKPEPLCWLRKHSNGLPGQAAAPGNSPGSDLNTF